MTVQSLNPLNLESMDAQVVDASPHEIAIVTQHHIAAQSEVKIRWDQRILFGEVRYCIPHGDRFRAGIRIKETLTLPHRAETV